MKRVIDFYGNVFILDSIMAISHGVMAKKKYKARSVRVTLRPHFEYIYNPDSQEWELIKTGKEKYDIHFETMKAAAEGLVEMKKFWEECINILEKHEGKEL